MAEPNQSAVNRPNALPVRRITVDELRQVLRPVLRELIKSKNSRRFRKPVDPTVHDNPLYYETIAKPIDLSKIKGNLEQDSYEDPWDFCEDIELMLQNCKVYNQPNSKIDKQRIKLHAEYYELIDPVMRELGYCCGRGYRHTPEIKHCEKANCLILPEQSYWTYKGIIICHGCFDEIETPIVEITWREDFTSVPKLDFQMLENDCGDQEEWVYCVCCERKFHQICVMHVEKIWPEGFYCDQCLANGGGVRRPHEFRAANITPTATDVFIENNVGGFLRLHNSTQYPVIVRTMHNQENAMRYQPRMRQRFSDTTGRFKYLQKTIYAFYEVDGKDVFIFGFTAQEYGSNCSASNKKRVYITHIDWLPFYQAQEISQQLFQEIISAYLQYVQLKGYHWAHAMLKPISYVETTLFRIRPLEQEIPAFRKFKQWFNQIADLGFKRSVIVLYQNIYQYVSDHRHHDARQIPYFADEHWPEVLERLIEGLQPGEDDNVLWTKLLNEMQQKKDQFMCMKFRRDPGQRDVRESDLTTTSGLSRKRFTILCDEQKLEFSDLRKAKFSTLALISEHLSLNPPRRQDNEQGAQGAQGAQ